VKVPCCQWLNSYRARYFPGTLDLRLQCGVAPHTYLFDCLKHPTHLTVRHLCDQLVEAADFIYFINYSLATWQHDMRQYDGLEVRTTTKCLVWWSDHVVCRKLSAADASRTSTQGCMQSSADSWHSTAATADVRDGLVLVCNRSLWRWTRNAEICMSFQGLLLRVYSSCIGADLPEKNSKH